MVDVDVVVVGAVGVVALADVVVEVLVDTVVEVVVDAVVDVEEAVVVVVVVVAAVVVMVAHAGCISVCVWIVFSDEEPPGGARLFLQLQPPRAEQNPTSVR